MARKPTQQFVVKALMQRKEDTVKSIASRKPNQPDRANVSCVVFECPRLNNYKNGTPMISFPKGCDWSTPYSHFLACVAGGDKEQLVARYHAVLADKTTHDGSRSISSYFDASLSSTVREKAMSNYLDIIISLSLPVSYVENSKFREFGGSEALISIKALRETIFKLVELVEMSIRKDLKGTRVAIMHDGWTKNGSHYLAIYAVFMRKFNRTVDGRIVEFEELSMPLLSLSPIAKRDDDGEIESAHAISFDATMHIQQLEHIFHYYHVNVHEWSVCQIADSCALNKSIAIKMDIPHVGCLNHKLALDVNAMVSSPVLKRTLEDVRTTMRECKSSIKNRAMLYRLTSLSTILPSATRWSGLFAMLNRFISIRDELQEVADTDGLDLTISRTNRFRTQCGKLAHQLNEINVVSKKLQERSITLENCRFLLDTLNETVTAQTNNPESRLYGCILRDEHTKLHSVHSPNSVFESAVVKTQRNETESMSDEERAACEHLKLDSGINGSEGDGEEESALSLSEIFKKRKRHRQNPVQSYMNLRFILGSSAEIEWLFSLAGGILADKRHRITPLLFESLLFLKVNRRYWNLHTVVSAMSNARSARISE